MSIFKEVLEDRIEDQAARLIRHIKYTDGEARDFMKPCVKKPTYLGYQKVKVIQGKRHVDPQRIYASYRKEIKN